jgi:hypothetical protein
MTRLTRSITAAAGLLAVCATLVIGAGAVGARSAGRADSGTAYVANTPKPGGLVYAAGYNQDKILGNGAILYVIKATPNTPGTLKVTARSVALYTNRGSLTGTATATLTVGTSGSAVISAGKLHLTKGFGTQKGHSMEATFTGTGSVSALAFVFHYKGTYK